MEVPTQQQQGKLIIFTAPSGAGKTTIVRHLLKKYDYLDFSVSATNRKRRDHEIDGRDYYFLKTDEFKTLVEKGDFLEWEEVYDNQFYGTLKSEVERIWKKGKHVIFDMEVKGATNIKKAFPDQSLAVFIKPPSPSSYHVIVPIVFNFMAQCCRLNAISMVTIVTIAKAPT